ncbi:hypothetical protein CF83_gp33 [Enterococcus phage IME_EF3]|uniref:Uncharacterized protein n=1 Tax=Enterococcus phage IME_EF3 TaxID=1416012 RepID=V5UPM7_9CAUD|nr:hypothetical protein CF83_gp33 [Enterococcus phage IME_EF3]AHB79784.1 hypothetical protein [Enterococcus phage IME_EF3]
MIIKEDVLDCKVITKGLKSGSFRGSEKLVERRNEYNAPEFDFNGATFYVENMEVEYKTNDCHVMRAIIMKEAKGGQSIDRFNLEVDYNANTMTLEEI